MVSYIMGHPVLVSSDTSNYYLILENEFKISEIYFRMFDKEFEIFYNILIIIHVDL